MKNYLNIRLESSKKDITKHNIRNKNSRETQDQDKVKIVNPDIDNFILYNGQVQILTKELQRQIRKENKSQAREADKRYIELYKKRSDNRKPKKNFSSLGNGVISFSEQLEFELDRKYSKEELFQAAKMTLEDFEKNTGSRIIENSLVLHMDEKGLPHFHFTFENFDDMGFSILENLKRNNHRTFKEDYKFDLSNMQDILFDNFKSLGMDRGIKKSISGSTHKNNRDYQREQDLKILELEAKIIELEEKIKGFEKDLLLAEKFMKEGFENFDKLSLSDISNAKIKYKDSRLIKRALSTLFKIKNTGNNIEKRFEELNNTVSKMSVEDKSLFHSIASKTEREKILSDSITIKSENLTVIESELESVKEENKYLNNFSDWTESPHKYVEKIKLVEKDKKLRVALKAIEEMKKLLEDTVEASNLEVQKVRKEVDLKVEELNSSIAEQNGMNDKHFTTLSNQDQRNIESLRRDRKSLIVQNNKHIIVYNVWQQAAKDKGLLPYFNSVENKLKPQIDKRLEELQEQYDMDSNIDIIKDIDLTDMS